MTGSLRAFISGSLALLLAMAGAIGVSPGLHHWLEHGGKGQPHIHRPPAPAFPASFGKELVSLRDAPSGSIAKTEAQPERHAEAAPQPEQSPAHEHHSLPQLVASGLIEQSAPPPLFVHRPVSFVLRVSPFIVFLLISDWEAQTASRGPPAIRSGFAV